MNVRIEANHDGGVCVIIPAYNESETIGKIVREAKRYVDTVLVVDDGSSDNTSAIAQEHGAETIRNMTNQGMGPALQRGYGVAIERGFDIIIQLDGDGQHNPRHIPWILEAINDCDIVIGSRFMNSSHRDYPLVRRMGISFFSFVVSRLGGVKVTDVTSGYRGLRTDCLSKLTPLTVRHWAVAQTLEAARLGLNIKETSIKMPLRETGHSQFSFPVYGAYPARVLWSVIRVMLSSRRKARVYKKARARHKSAGLLRLCVIRQPSPTPDTHVHTLSLLKILRPLAERIYLITGNFPEDTTSDEVLRIINLPSKGYYSKKVLEINRPGALIQCLWTDIRFCYRLLRLSRKIDTVIFFVAMTFPLTMLMAKLLRKEIVFIVTGSAKLSAEKVPMKDLFGIGTFLIPRIVGLLEAGYFFLADRIIVELEETIRWLGIDKYRHKTTIGRFLIDTDLFKVEQPYETRENIVGYIGSFIHSKGVINLARAVPLVLKSRTDVKFMLGGGGPLFSDIESELKQNGLSDRVNLHGWIPHEEVRGYLNQMKLLVMPSYTEGGVQAIALEAMACGTPVLTTSVAGITELIEDGKNGFILDGDSPQYLADKILAALEHPALSNIRENGTRLVKEEYSYEAVSKRYREILYGR